jgi:Reverse transcriptase (RNA-dependent DNA polymerase)
MADTKAKSVVQTTQPTTTTSSTYASAVVGEITTYRTPTITTEESDKATFQKRNNPPDSFKGMEAKMHGNVFQLAEEGRKQNQFTLTLQALQDYVSIELDNPGDLSPLFETPPRAVVLQEPPDMPPFNADRTERVPTGSRKYISWKFQCEDYDSRVALLPKNLQKLFTIISLQCSHCVKTKVESTPGFALAKSTHNCVWLIANLKNICHKFETTEYRFNALTNAKLAAMTYRQGQYQSNNDYYEVVKELVDVLESYGGTFHDPPSAAPPSANISSLTEAEQIEYMRNHCLASFFLKNADPHRYGKLKTDLAEGFSQGRDEFPSSMTAVLQLLSSRFPHTPIRPASNQQHNRAPSVNGGRGGGRGSQPGRGGRSGRTFVQVALSLAQVENYFPDGIPAHFVLLDSDSTVSIFCNSDLLVDIHEVDEPLYLETNGGGYQVSTHMGTVPDFGLVWYNPDSIANILSLAQVRRVRRVTMDSAQLPAFQVHKPDGSGATLFVEHESGLYLYDASVPVVPVTNSINASIVSYSCLQTVAENKLKFTARQIESADAARKLYRLMGRPGYQRFLAALRDNLILNCPLTVDDANRAELIYGKDVAFLKGKTTASPAKDHVPDFVPIALPPELLSLHSHVTLCFDIFYVLGLSFSLSTSRSLRYLSCRHMPDRTKPVLQSCISSDLALYRNRGFIPHSIHADGEYNAVSDSFPGVHFSICSADDHVPEIERAIRTVKESIRATIHGLPFSRLPRVLVKELAASAVRTLNMLPHPDGISLTMSPATIITGSHKPDYHAMSLEFGTYVQVYDGTSNDTKSRTLGAIATNPTGNTSGDFYFMSLATGHRIHRRSWTVIPISDAVISRVHALALHDNMPPVETTPILTEYDPDDIVDPSIYDRDYTPPIHSDNESDHHLTTDAYTDDSDSDSDDDNGHHPDFDDALPDPPQNEERDPVQNEERATVPPLFLNQERILPVPPPANEDCHIPLIAERTPPLIPVPVPLPAPVPPVLRRTGLRPSHPPNYNHRFQFTQSHSTDSVHTHSPTSSWTIPHTTISSTPSPDGSYAPTGSVRKAITGLMFTQMSAQKGIKKYGTTALDALRKEFQQFKALDVLEPLDAFTLSDELKSESLRSISVIKEKRDGSLKGRTCADGSTQQGKFTKAETSSSTISNDALFLSIMIDAYENRDVATADVAGAYLHAPMKQFISMRFTGWAVDLLCEVNPDYSAYVVYEKNIQVLYVRCNKAIYGCVVSGVLWYELFSETLAQHGFTINPYDFCIANATFEGTQCTIGWFVDDTKISHINPNIVTKIIKILESRFGTMSITRGLTHTFLGMHITYHCDGTASIHMPSYINEAISESGLNITKAATTPAAINLLVVDPTSPLLPPAKARVFHSVVAKLIYVGTRARTDILLALSFLCGRVSAPTIQDESKLERLLSYLFGTIDLTLRIGADSLNQFSTWVDASFAVHPDMRSHTGGIISFGRGGLICKSKKQNINTKSSTEAELIGASDYLPNTLYVKLFMEAQGYPVTTAIFHQDNESAIKMEQNGKASTGHRSRHIDIRYFFITDHAKRHSIRITHCPTADMLADFFTKPLQGSLFRKFRSVLLGHAHTSTLTVTIPTS